MLKLSSNENECKPLLWGLRSFRIEDNPDYRKLFPESGNARQILPATSSTRTLHRASLN